MYKHGEHKNDTSFTQLYIMLKHALMQHMSFQLSLYVHTGCASEICSCELS